MTWSMANAVTAVYPTPAALMEAYDACMDDGKRDALLADVEFERGKRIGAKVSRACAALFNTEGELL